MSQGIPEFNAANEVLRTGKVDGKYFVVKVFRIDLLFRGKTTFNLPSPHVFPANPFITIPPFSILLLLESVFCS